MKAASTVDRMPVVFDQFMIDAQSKRPGGLKTKKQLKRVYFMSHPPPYFPTVMPPRVESVIRASPGAARLWDLGAKGSEEGSQQGNEDA